MAATRMFSLVSAFIACLLIVGLHSQDTINHVNLGYILKGTDTVRLYTNEASFTFSIRLPLLTPRPVMPDAW